MLSAANRSVWFRTVVSIILSALPLSAIQPPDVPVGPIPMQILAAHKVFISNGETSGRNWPPNIVYDAFYTGMKTWGKYELATTPADADVDLRFATSSPLTRT